MKLITQLVIHLTSMSHVSMLGEMESHCSAVWGFQLAQSVPYGGSVAKQILRGGTGKECHEHSLPWVRSSRHSNSRYAGSRAFKEQLDPTSAVPQ